MNTYWSGELVTVQGAFFDASGAQVDPGGSIFMDYFYTPDDVNLPPSKPAVSQYAQGGQPITLRRVLIGGLPVYQGDIPTDTLPSCTVTYSFYVTGQTSDRDQFRVRARAPL